MILCTILPPVPVYAEGADPTSSKAEVLDQVTIKRELLPSTERLVRPFAYRVSREGVRRVLNTLQEGDTVIISQDPGLILPDEIYAIRCGKGIILSKVLEKGSALLLLSDEGQGHIDMLPAPRQGGIRALLAGRVVVAIRAWQYAVVSLKK